MKSMYELDQVVHVLCTLLVMTGHSHGHRGRGGVFVALVVMRMVTLGENFKLRSYGHETLNAYLIL